MSSVGVVRFFRERISGSSPALRLVVTFWSVLAFNGVLLAQSARSSPNPHPRVLVLHSYHYGFTWSQNISQGIASYFASNSPGTEVVTEFMDVKRMATTGYFESLRDLYLLKYRDETVDAIIAADDWALRFLTGIGSDFFPDAPVVFCGLADYNPENLRASPRKITGIVENTNIRATLQTALGLHPGTDVVAYVSDATVTGRIMKRRAERAFAEFPDSIQFQYIEHGTMAQLQNDVANLPHNAVILAFIFTEDEFGRIWTHEYNLERMADSSDVPIYSVWEFYLGHGIMGGMLTSGSVHGGMAAHMTLRILNGEDASDIPVQTDNPNRYMFDFRYLQRFGVETEDLPEESMVINQPRTIYEEYTAIFWGAILTFAVLLLLIVLLALNVVLRRRSQRARKESEQLFRAFMDQIPGLTFIKDLNGKVVFANQGFRRYLDLLPSTMIGTTNHDVFPPEFAEKLDESDWNTRDQGKNVETEETYGGRTWSTRKFLIHHNGSRILLGGVSLDITERKRAERELADALEMLNTAQEVADIGTWWVALPSREIHWSAQLYKIFGIPAGESAPSMEEFLSRVHPEDREMVQDKAREQIAASQPRYEYTYRIRLASGETKYLEHIGRPTHDDQGNILRVLGTIQDVTERTEADQRIKASLHEKELLLRELYHRTKNNMQVISAFLELQAGASEDPVVYQIIQDGVTRIRTMALAHEMLYRAQSLSRINLREYVADLIELLTTSYGDFTKRVTIVQEVQEIPALIDIAIPCGLIINELLSNCVKHAFPADRRGQVEITLVRKEMAHLELSVEDNGIGAPPGFRLEENPTLGLQIVRQVAWHQLQGEVHLETDGGFRWRITFRDDIYSERV